MDAYNKSMRSFLLLTVLLPFLAPPSFARHPEWQEGKLVLSTSAMVDGYQNYKLGLYMGDELGAVLWNGRGEFGLAAGDPESGDTERFRIVWRSIRSMLADCRQTQADFCSHQVPIRYHRDTCAADHVPCLAVDFPLDPERGLGGKHKTVWIVAPILTADEVRTATGRTCVSSRYYDCSNQGEETQ